MLTLEEAIKAEEAETLAYEECLNSLDDNMPTDMWNELNKSLGKQMYYHRQLAEWLTELKDYREHEFCRYCEERYTSIFDEPCKSCKIHFVRKKGKH